MEEVQQNSVSPEVAPQAEAPKQEAVEQESRQDRNWREMRKQQDELRKVVKEQSDVIQQLKTASIKEEPDEFASIGDDEFIPKGKVKKLVEKEAQKIAKEVAHAETEQFRRQSANQADIQRLKGNFSDFDEVVNPETIALLEEQDPELAESIAEVKDPYKFGLLIYKNVKSLNIQEKVPSARRTKEGEKKIEANAKTVPSPQAYDKRPMAQAFRMTDSEKSKLYEEMMGFASGASAAPPL